MREYLVGLFAFALCCGVVEWLCPKGSMEKHIKWMSGLCLLCVTVSPLTQLLSEAGSLPDRMEEWVNDWIEGEPGEQEEYLDRWQEESERMDLAYAQETVASMLEQRFGLSADQCRVELTVDGQTSSITHMRVALSGQGIWTNTHELEAYVKQTFGCEVVVYIE